MLVSPTHIVTPLQPSSPRPRPTSRRSHHVVLALCWLTLWMTGCATHAPPRHESPLATEQRWLNEWFRGTPVLVALDGPQALRLEVPLANSFGAGSAELKPALSAVLDRVAASLRRQAAARVSISASNDDKGTTLLAAARVRRISEHLTTQGIDRARMTSLSSSARDGAPVRLRITLTTPPIERLDDASLWPAAGRPR